MGTLSSFPALGTTATILVTDPGVLPAAMEVLQGELNAIDVACSRFRRDSELAQINAAAGRPVRVSPLFFEAVEIALRGAQMTDGRVTPTVGSAMKVLGYDRDFTVIAREGAGVTVTAVAVPAWQVVEVDASSCSVRVPAGVELDLGATAKAMCADRAARAAAARVGGGVLVSLGGDIAVAGPPPAGGWAIRVTHDHADPPDGPGQTVTITAGGLATSSTEVRQWERGGTTVHHLLDPSTGQSARGCWQTVSVAAGSCVDANIASTSSIILGGDAPGWLEQRRLPARLVDSNGAVTIVAGWPTPPEAG